MRNWTSRRRSPPQSRTAPTLRGSMKFAWWPSQSLRMPDFDAAHDRAAADDERRRAGRRVSISPIDDAAEDCQDAVLDAPAARHLDLHPAPERQHVDHGLGRDLRVSEVDVASAHDRDDVASGEIARRYAASHAAHHGDGMEGVVAP